jgi:hypothetical protein
MKKKNRGGGNDGQIDVFDLCGVFSSRSFLEIHQSNEVPQLSIKVTKFRELQRSNKVTKVATTQFTDLIVQPPNHASGRKYNVPAIA